MGEKVKMLEAEVSKVVDLPKTSLVRGLKDNPIQKPSALRIIGGA